MMKRKSDLGSWSVLLLVAVGLGSAAAACGVTNKEGCDFRIFLEI